MREKEKEKLRFEELSKVKGLENLTEEEVEEAMDTIDKLCYVLMKILRKEHINKSELKKTTKQNIS